jgi:uncharacterized protein involved in exopolysaccharide biosynthesis
MNASSEYETRERAMNINELLSHIWRRRVLVIAASFVGAGLGLAAGALIEETYTAEVVISPSASEPGSAGLGGLGALASQYSGLASLAGIAIEGGGEEEAVAVLQSELLTRTYIEEQNLLPVLYADEWDASARRWKSSDPDKEPTLWKANQFFKREVREVTEDLKTGLFTLAIEWRDPNVAAKWANDLVKLTNSYLQTKAIRESERNIAYLNEQAAKTDVVEARRVIYTLLQEEMNRQMLARGRDEYALKVVDPAFVPESPSSPSPIVLALAGLLIAALLAVAWIVARTMFSLAAQDAAPPRSTSVAQA